MKSILLTREVNNRIHRTHLHEDVIMHLDIIEKLVEKALRNGVRIKLIEEVWENGYTREDQ